MIENTTMSNPICVITGCNSGIGKAAAIELAKQGFDIIMLVRDSDKSRLAYEEIQSYSSGKVDLKYVDLASLESINKVSDEIKTQYKKIDILINNAGLVKRRFEKSADNFEMTIAVNYFATFSLTMQLLPLLEMSDRARIINVTSELYKNGEVHLDNDFSSKKYNGNKAYANSKLLVIYFTEELAKRLSSSNITVNCVHPGVVGTDVFRDYPQWFAKLLNVFIAKPDEGAKPIVYLASSSELDDTSGSYFYKTQPKQTTANANDVALYEKIWGETEKLTGVAYAEHDTTQQPGRASP